MCAHKTNQQKHCDFVNDHKTKWVQDQGPSKLDFSLLVCFFDVWWAFLTI